jgi:hypothetical protein
MITHLSAGLFLLMQCAHSSVGAQPDFCCGVADRGLMANCLNLATGLDELGDQCCWLAF